MFIPLSHDVGGKCHSPMEGNQLLNGITMPVSDKLTDITFHDLQSYTITPIVLLYILLKSNGSYITRLKNQHLHISCPHCTEEFVS